MLCILHIISSCVTQWNLNNYSYNKVKHQGHYSIIQYLQINNSLIVHEYYAAMSMGMTNEHTIHEYAE